MMLESMQLSMVRLWVFQMYHGGQPSHCKLHMALHVFLDCTDVSNSEFVCGKAEDVMPQLQKDMKFWEEAVGVVDPPRAGLRK